MIHVKRMTRAATFWVAVVLLAIDASGAEAQTRPDPLAGIRKVRALVDYSATGRSPSGISEQRLQTILELKLRTAGLRVLTREEDLADPEMNPYVHLQVTTLETHSEGGTTLGYAYCFDLEAEVFGGIVPFNQAIVPMELWSDGEQRSTEYRGHGWPPFNFFLDCGFLAFIVRSRRPS